MKIFKLLLATVIFINLAACGNSSMTGRESYKHYGEKIEDTKIITHVRNSFRTNSLIPDKLIYLAVDRGIVQLSGFVHSQQQADLAVASIQNTPGVKGVINNLIVMSSEAYAQQRAQAERHDAGR